MKTKLQVFAFIALSLAGASIAPLVNIALSPKIETEKITDSKYLFNLDFAFGWLASALYPLGVSLSPKQVVIGYDQWLFLGDEYQDAIATSRRKPTDKDLLLATKIGSAAQAWEAYFSRKGVKLFRVMIAPNKDTIYSEHLPKWVNPLTPGLTDALVVAGGERYIDLRPALIRAKGKETDLYYKTDSHWNYFGAGVAFQEFARKVSPEAPEIRWPGPALYEVHTLASRSGGDLTSFLRVSEKMADAEPLTKVCQPPPVLKSSDFDGNVHRREAPQCASGSPFKPVLVRSPSAINNAKVLWLGDSFSSHMSPYMFATFSDVLQFSWAKGVNPNGRLIELVDKFEPDYIFFTIVERFSMSEWFAIRPPE